MFDNNTQINLQIKASDLDIIDEGKPFSFGEWLKLKLSDDELQTITDNIIEEIDKIDEERKPKEEKIKEYRNQYDQIVAETSLPFPGAFNLCYSDDTEVLTSEGWKFIKDVKIGEKVLSREPLTAKLEYKSVLSTQHFKNIKQLIKIRHRSFELFVTEDHNIFVESKSEKRFRFIKAKDLKRLKGGDEGIPSSGGKWNSEEAQEIFGFDMDIFLNFLGWYISEGCVFKSGTVAIAQCVDRKRKLIKDCLDKMGVNYSETKNLFLVSLPPEVVSYLKSLGKSWEKYIPRIYLDLPPRQLKILFNSLINGDGHKTKRDKDNRQDRYIYYTSSKRLADDIQELILKLGYSASIVERNNIGKKTMYKTRPFNPCITRHLEYQIEVRYTNYFDLRRINKEYIDYNSDVYCISINEWNVIYVRRNGKAVWCGQCVPLTVKDVDACVSQTEEAFEDVDPKWVIETPPDKNLIPARDIQEKILDYYSDSEMEDVETWTKIYHDAFLLGNSWNCMVFKRDFIRVRDYREYSDVESFVKDFPQKYLNYPKYLEQLAQRKTIRLIVDYDQEVCRSAKPEFAEWEDIYVPLATEGIAGMLKARIVARRIWMRFEDISILEKEGDYRDGISKKLKYPLTESKVSSTEIDPDYLKKDYETFEVQYFVDIDKDGKEERCLFNIEKERHLCMRAIRYPYNHGRPYVIPYFIQKTRKGIYQPGLGEKLQQINITANALVNHILNASIIANSLSLKVRTGTDAVRALYEHQWYPGSILELMNVDDVQQFTFNTPNLSSLINLFVLIEKFGQDVSGITDYLVGQESPEDPTAPASKTIALMKKSELKLRRYIKNLKRSNNEAGYQALRLIYQYVPKERIARILGKDISEVESLQYPLRAITKSSGFAIEKMFEKRDNMQWLALLMKDPLIFNNAVKRVTLYEVLAKDFGSDWDKKLTQIITKEEAQKAQRAEQIQRMKANVIQQAVKQAMDSGATEEEARQIGLSAGDKFEQMMKEQGTIGGQGGPTPTESI